MKHLILLLLLGAILLVACGGGSSQQNSSGDSTTTTHGNAKWCPYCEGSGDTIGGKCTQCGGDGWLDPMDPGY